MSRFFDTMKQDTPRLVVMYRNDNGKDMFQWGIVGQMPLMPLIGSIIRVQVSLSIAPQVEESDDEYCPQPALVIARSEENQVWFVNPTIPVDALLGMLETIKITLTETQLARKAAAQQLILGPDGQPIRA